MSRGVVVRAAVAGLALSSAVRAADLLPPMLGRAQDFAVRRAGAEADARIRLNTSGEGLHRVTGAALTAAGVPAEQLVGGRMRLFNRDREVAVFTTTDALFGADDALVFYAEPWETVYTRTNVYWLGFADGGTHMAARGAAPAADPAVTTAWHTVVHEPDLLYANNYRPNDASLDHWFAGFMTRSNGDYNVFALATPDKDPAAHVASIELTIHGTTSDPAYDPDHATSISLNGVFVGTVATDGVASVVGSVDFGSGILSSTTTVSLLQYAGGS